MKNKRATNCFADKDSKPREGAEDTPPKSVSNTTPPATVFRTERVGNSWRLRKQRRTPPRHHRRGEDTRVAHSRFMWVKFPFFRLQRVKSHKHQAATDSGGKEKEQKKQKPCMNLHQLDQSVYIANAVAEAEEEEAKGGI